MGGSCLHIAKYPFLTSHLNPQCLACITCIHVNISVIMFGIQLALSAHVNESRYKMQRQINYIISAAIAVSHFIKSQPFTMTRANRTSSRVNSEHKFTFRETSVFVQHQGIMKGRWWSKNILSV